MKSDIFLRVFVCVEFSFPFFFFQAFLNAAAGKYINNSLLLYTISALVFYDLNLRTVYCVYILVDSYSFIFFSFTLLFSFRRLFCVCPSERSAQHLAVIPSCYPFCLMWNRWKTTRPSRPADCAPTPLFMT